MRVKDEGLGPGVQDGDHPRCRNQPSPTHLTDGLPDSCEEQRVATTAVHHEERLQTRRHGEDDGEVVDRQQLTHLLLDPACCSRP